MRDLHHLKGNTYYINGNTNIGVYKLNEEDVVLIDTSVYEDREIIYNILIKHNLKVKYIVLTHSHPDHSASSQFLAKKFGAKLISSKIERAFFRDNKLDIGFLFGGYPLEDFDTPLMHIEETREIYSLDTLPDGLRSFKLKGHHYGMIGIKTDDDVYFIADTLGSIDLVDKQHILLMYDVKGYIETLDYINTLKGNILVPSHSEVARDLSRLIEFNKQKIYEIMDNIINILAIEQTMEDLVSSIFTHYNLRMTYNKYLLITSTIRSYVSYLSSMDKITHQFINNKLYFKAKII